jgi:hypothetical protein
MLKANKVIFQIYDVFIKKALQGFNNNSKITLEF